MTREEIDAIWQKAMHSAIKANEPSTRYEFANLIIESVASTADIAYATDHVLEAIRSMKT